MTDKEQIENNNGQPAKMSLIGQIRREYEDTLSEIENNVIQLIKEGKELQGLLLLQEKKQAISDIHELLSGIYILYQNNIGILLEFESPRFKKLINNNDEEMFDALKTTSKSYGDEISAETQKTILNNLFPSEVNIQEPERSVSEIMRSVMDEIESGELNLVIDDPLYAGTKWEKYWYLNTLMLAEIEYILEKLEVLVEPDFIPLEYTRERKEAEEKDINRYIPGDVKISVWRRDQGRCVQCGSQEKLEYDHIIPVSKGGSNTERNIQLLCEKCNREKAAKIS